jgi:Zn ribbon nucleic-acid-binding protein
MMGDCTTARGGWEAPAGNKPTGRENTVQFSCGECGHKEPEQPWPLDRASVAMRECSACGAHRMKFVAWEAGAEKEPP